MPYPIVAVLTGFVLTALWLVTVLVLDVYWHLRQPEVVNCPATDLPAAVRVRASSAASPRVTRCSRWPLHRNCSQACLESAEGGR